LRALAAHPLMANVLTHDHAAAGACVRTDRRDKRDCE
jgi:hypothetical protein